MARGRDVMRGIALLWSLALGLAPRVATSAEVQFVYVRPNVGGASGGHAAFVADGTVYHVQTDGDGLFRIVRDRSDHFEYVYGKLQNRPLSIAHVVVSDGVRDALVDRFARAYVEQDFDYARREERALDVAWLEALQERQPLPPLRAAGLLSPRHPDDRDARALAARLSARVGTVALASSSVKVSASDPAALREQLALREALRALEHAYGLDPDAFAVLPDAFDDPLAPGERAALESLAMELEQGLVELLSSTRPDRGYAMLLLEARILAIQRSLAENRLRVLDPFDAWPPPRTVHVPVSSADARARRLAYLGRVLRRGRATVLAPGRLDESSYNLLEEAAGVIERDERGSAGAELLEVSRQQVPARARSVALGAHALTHDAPLATARARLASAEQRLRERWGYALLQRNCITELADLTAAAFASLDAADAALGGRIPHDEPLAVVPAVFFARVSERLRIARIEHRPSYRVSSLAVLTERDPRIWTRARESIAPLSQLYTPRWRDGAFLLFTDDVFWRRPLYGTANLAYGLGYAAMGLVSSPVDGGARARAGLTGALWSLPELGFQNVRKGTFEFVDPDPR
jgi:hypothetical protein